MTTTAKSDHLKLQYMELRDGQKKWAATPIKERITLIENFAKLLQDNKQELATTLTGDMCKPITQSCTEIDKACQRIHFFAEHSEQWLLPAQLNEENDVREVLTYEPHGVIANISAWNSPYLVGVNIFVPALIGGNAVLYKPSSHTTKTGLHLEALIHEAGIPKNVFRTTPGNSEVGKQLLELPLDGYFFTGSAAIGKVIAHKVAPKMVPVGLELGGKDPVYITDQVATIEQAAQETVNGAYYNNGQSCCAVERIYVHKNVYHDFLSHFLKIVRTLKLGDPFDTTTNLGPLARPQHYHFLNDQIQDAINKGAKIEVGGIMDHNPDGFFEPTVLSNVDHTMRIMKEETFGPVIGIQSVETDEEAIRLMNDTCYGLTASVYSSDITRAETILENVDTGTAYINCCDRVSPYLPWSGRRDSGIGSTLSYLGILAFVRPKSFHVKG